MAGRKTVRKRELSELYIVLALTIALRTNNNLAVTAVMEESDTQSSDQATHILDKWTTTYIEPAYKVHKKWS